MIIESGAQNTAAPISLYIYRREAICDKDLYEHVCVLDRM